MTLLANASLDQREATAPNIPGRLAPFLFQHLGADFVPSAGRVATFDNDRTLWCEPPVYFQVAFALDRVKALAPQHPEWRPSSRSRRCLKRT
jgi:hypothetical protein